MSAEIGTQDLVITIFSCRKTGTYAYSIEGYKPLSRMACGSIPSATTGTLLTVALLSALRSWAPGQSSRLLAAKGEIQPKDKPNRKLRILVKSSQPHFVEILEHATRTQSVRQQSSRASGHLLDELLLEFQNYEFMFGHASEETFYRLKLWTGQVHKPRLYRNFPAPTVVRCD
jgi:hypothetical protein